MHHKWQVDHQVLGSLSNRPAICFSLGPPAYCLTAGRPLSPRSLSSPPDISFSLDPHTALKAGWPPSPRSLSSPPDHCFSLGPPAYCLTAGRPLNPRSLTSPPDISLSLGPPSYCFHSRPTNQSKVTLQPSSSQFLTGPQLAHTVTMTRRIFTHPVYTKWPHFLPCISCCALARASYSQVPGPYPPNHLHTAPVLLLVHLRGQPVLFPHSQLQLRPNLVLLCHLQGHHPHFIWPNCVLHNQALRAVHRLKRVINESCEIVQTRECESMLPSHEPMLAGFSLTLSQPTNDQNKWYPAWVPSTLPRLPSEFWPQCPRSPPSPTFPGVLLFTSILTTLSSVRCHLPHPPAAVHCRLPWCTTLLIRRVLFQYSGKIAQ